MLVFFCYLRAGVLEQVISVYEVDEPARQLYLVKTEHCLDIEKKLIELSKIYDTKYINILNDKELEKHLIDTYDFKKWEELF